MSTATVSSKYQISLPKAVREAMQIQPGQQFEFIPMGNVLQLAPKTSIKDLRGIARGKNPAYIREQ
jgi:AbrB family looped-hinge helix DNA binding protein